MRSCEHEVIEPLKSDAVSGSIPKWLKGTLLRNGPGSLKVDEYRYQHLFDCFALLHKYVLFVGIRADPE
jgi:carotenoid isomerooxygenase